VEMVRLFQTELEHYEKVEGMALSLEGKANQLGGMIRRNLPMAMEGLAVVPIYAGYDLRRRIGRIFKYDLTGGRYEEGDFHATGPGGRDARTTIKLGTLTSFASNEMVARSAANLAWAKTILAHNLNLYDIFTHDHVVIAKDALELIEETFA